MPSKFSAWVSSESTDRRSHGRPSAGPAAPLADEDSLVSPRAAVLATVESMASAVAADDDDDGSSPPTASALLFY
jgi:hypothetical protein